MKSQRSHTPSYRGTFNDKGTHFILREEVGYDRQNCHVFKLDNQNARHLWSDEFYRGQVHYEEVRVCANLQRVIQILGTNMYFKDIQTGHQVGFIKQEQFYGNGMLTTRYLIPDYQACKESKDLVVFDLETLSYRKKSIESYIVGATTFHGGDIVLLSRVDHDGNQYKEFIDLSSGDLEKAYAERRLISRGSNSEAKCDIVEISRGAYVLKTAPLGSVNIELTIMSIGSFKLPKGLEKYLEDQKLKKLQDVLRSQRRPRGPLSEKKLY